MFLFDRSLLPLVAIAALLAPSAHAQGFELKLGKKTKHGSIAISLGNGAGHGYGYGRDHCAPPPRVWIPAHYETRCERVWVPGRCETIWIEPVYQWRHDACGRAFQVVVCAGHWQTIERPGCWESRNVQVWVEGRWQ